MLISANVTNCSAYNTAVEHYHLITCYQYTGLWWVATINTRRNIYTGFHISIYLYPPSPASVVECIKSVQSPYMCVSIRLSALSRLSDSFDLRTQKFGIDDDLNNNRVPTYMPWQNSPTFWGEFSLTSAQLFISKWIRQTLWQWQYSWTHRQTGGADNFTSTADAGGK